jgi:hypothetical protein
VTSWYADDITAQLKDGTPSDKSVARGPAGHNGIPASGCQIT